ncbi:hypothetical protein BDV93DRAFT_567230 [Ceratobasidium sp. AG-I]|nr:hypothetical protein BDV93DRAFT_567230 [Ceratobasidium sp. AG-I]
MGFTDFGDIASRSSYNRPFRSADRALERTYQPSMLDPLRDAKDHAYDPPIAASTPPSEYSMDTAKTLPLYNSYDVESRQPAYVPPPQENEGTSPHPQPQHRTSYGFPHTQTPPTGST